MNQSFQLFQLQKVDSQIDDIEARVAEIEKILASDKRIFQATENMKKNRIKLNKERKLLRVAEEKVRKIGLEIEKNMTALYSGRIINPRELNDLQEKIASDKRHLSVLEDEQLEAMIVVENSEETLKKAESNFTKIQAEVISQQANLRGEREQMNLKRSRLESERGVKIGSITDESLDIYSNLRKSKRGIAIARVDEKTCLACGSILTPSEWQAARSPHQIVFCSSCGRILYAG